MVKILNSTIDPITKLDYNYGKLHETGLDRRSPDQELQNDEKDLKNGIKPLTDSDIKDFLKQHKKK